MARLVINAALKGAVLYLLSLFGVLKLHDFVGAGSPWGMIWSALLLGLAFLVLYYIAWRVYVILAVVSAGLALILLPFLMIGMGYLTLRLMASWFPQALTLTAGFWLTLLASLIVAFVGLKPRSNQAPSSPRRYQYR